MHKFIVITILTSIIGLTPAYSSLLNNNNEPQNEGCRSISIEFGMAGKQEENPESYLSRRKIYELREKCCNALLATDNFAPTYSSTDPHITIENFFRAKARSTNEDINFLKAVLRKSIGVFVGKAAQITFKDLIMIVKEKRSENDARNETQYYNIDNIRDLSLHTIQSATIVLEAEKMTPWLICKKTFINPRNKTMAL